LALGAPIQMSPSGPAIDGSSTEVARAETATDPNVEPSIAPMSRVRRATVRPWVQVPIVMRLPPSSSASSYTYPTAAFHLIRSLS
jgi:hypothetical protein